jgi:hypothetical protein
MPVITASMLAEVANVSPSGGLDAAMAKSYSVSITVPEVSTSRCGDCGQWLPDLPMRRTWAALEPNFLKLNRNDTMISNVPIQARHDEQNDLQMKCVPPTDFRAIARPPLKPPFPTEYEAAHRVEPRCRFNSDLLAHEKEGQVRFSHYVFLMIII